jgi:Domain of unknown function (DUF4124)
MPNAVPAYVVYRLRTLRLGLLTGALAGMLVATLAGCGAAAAAEPGSSAAGSNNGATTTYRWVDAQGVVHYSDTPQPGAQKLEIAPAQTFQPGPIPTTQSVGEVGPRADQYTCLITQPQPQQSIYAPETVPVSVQLSPDLRSGDHVQVSFDGAAVSPVDDSGLDFQIDMPVRGQHEVTATVVDSNGKTVCTSPAVTFYVRRPSVLTPQSPTAHPAPPRPPLGR